MPLDLSIFEEALRATEEKRSDTFTSLSGSSGALFFSMFRGTCLLLCPSEDSAGEFYSNALFWSRLLQVEAPVLIPAKDTPLRSKNLLSLYTLNRGKFIASVDAMVSPLWKIEDFPVFTITKGVIIDRDVIVQNLQKQGYHIVPVVTGEGEMSVRGGILDIFPPDEEDPVRIEFFDDEIESLRFFDIDTQLSLKEINDIHICPATEPEEGPNLLELLSDSTLILHEPDDIRRHWPGVEEIVQIHDRQILSFTSLPLHNEGFCFPINSVSGFGILPEARKTVDDFIKKTLELIKQYFILIVCSSEGQAKRLKELFLDHGSDVPILGSNAVLKDVRSPVITIGVLNRGFTYQDVIVLSGIDIFGQRPSFKSVKKSRISTLISSIEDYKEGDSATTLSGGEAQRVKLSRELSKRATGKTLYILDEPTTGLHFIDIQKLLDVLNQLVDAGNSVVVIEHNLDVIKSADYLIDLGPEGGDEGGKIIAEGTPEEVAKNPKSYTGKFLKEKLIQMQ